MGLGGVCHADGRFWMAYRDPRVAALRLSKHNLTLQVCAAQDVHTRPTRPVLQGNT